MTVTQLSRSGASVYGRPEDAEPMYGEDDRNESSPAKWATSELEVDPDLALLADDPDFYEALLEARAESVHDAPSLEEAERWLERG